MSQNPAKAKEGGSSRKSQVQFVKHVPKFLQKYQSGSVKSPTPARAAVEDTSEENPNEDALKFATIVSVEDTIIKGETPTKKKRTLDEILSETSGKVYRSKDPSSPKEAAPAKDVTDDLQAIAEKIQGNSKKLRLRKNTKKIDNKALLSFGADSDSDD